MSTKEYDFKGFDRIRISGAFDVEITRAEAFSVSISADPLKPVQVNKEGDTLSIGLPWYYYFWGFLSGWMRARARISMPELRELRLAGASKAEVSDFSTTHDFALEVAGASKLSLGSIGAGGAELKLVGASEIGFKRLEAAKLSLHIVGASRLKGELAVATDVEVRMAGASKVELTGMANSLSLDVAGASRATLSELAVHNARVKLVGASKAVVKADGRLDAELAGASDLSWIGNPVMGDIKSVGGIAAA